jgi:hypothetical protein
MRFNSRGFRGEDLLCCLKVDSRRIGDSTGARRRNLDMGAAPFPVLYGRGIRMQSASIGPANHRIRLRRIRGS